MGHPNAERLRKKLESMHIFYYNYIDEIKYITEKCILCKIKSKNVKIVNDNPRPIIFMYPRDRYILDAQISLIILIKLIIINIYLI